MNKIGGRLLILFGIFFCTLFFLVNGQSWATEKKTSKEQIQLERTSDLIITVQCGKSSEESVVPNCVLPHGYGTDYFFNIVEVKKGTLSDRTMKMTFFNSPSWLDNDELYSVMREKQLLKLYYVKKAKPEAPAWMSGLGGDFTDSQGVFWKLVFLEKIFADTSPRDTTTGQKLTSPYSDCRDPLAEPLKKIIGNFELAKESDFIPVIRQYEVSPDNFQHAELEMLTCTHFSVDLNQDGLKDKAVLLVQQGGKNFRFQILINQGKDTFKPTVTRDYKSVTTIKEGVIYTSMAFKPANRGGLGSLDYSPLNTEERKTYLTKPAVEIWDYPDPNPNGTPKNITEVSTLAYCSIGYYFVQGKLESVRVCD